MTKKELPEVDEFAELQATMIDKASKVQGVIDLAKKITEITTKWAEENGISTIVAKKGQSLASKRISKRFDDLVENKGATGNSGMSSNQWTTLKELIEVLLDEPLITKKFESAVSKIKLKAGIAIKMTSKKYDHAYPIGACIFVIDPDNLKGVLDNGMTPASGCYLIPEVGVIDVVTEAEILKALANMYIYNRSMFTEISKL